MKAVRCPNGHWYDSESYNKCPHCSQTSSAIQTRSDEIEKSSKKGFSLFKKNKNSKIATSSKVGKIYNSSLDEEKWNISVTHDDVTERFFADIDDDKTVSMFNESDMVGNENVYKRVENLEYEVASSHRMGTSEPLAAVVQRISTMDEGKTLSYFNAMTSQNDLSSSVTAASKISDPVVGWLVAISGVHLGESFQLYVGKNTIGRGSNNKVVLGLDQSISRENHATIVYEPKRREFYLQSGNSDGLIYLNGSFVNGSECMKEKDTLEIGMTKLIFIPLCGSDFTWEQYM